MSFNFPFPNPSQGSLAIPQHDIVVTRSLEIVTVLPPPCCKIRKNKGGKTVTLCPKPQKKFPAFGTDLTKINGFYTSCWASTAGGGKFLSFFASFWDDFTVKNEHFLRVLQAISIKNFLRPDDLVVAKQGGEFLIRGEFLI